MEGQPQQRNGGGGELFELAPPMDPPAGSNGATVVSSANSPAINRPRPVTLPNLSAGLAAISANYGNLFDEDFQQQHSGTNQFKTSNGPSASLAPLMAAAFRRPSGSAQQNFQQSPAILYSPYSGSQPSEPCTPTMGINCFSSNQSPYMGAFSPIAPGANCLDSLGVGAIPWTWSLLGTGCDFIGGYPTDPQQLLLQHSTAQNLLSPPTTLVDLYAQQQQPSQAENIGLLVPNPQHPLNEHLFYVPNLSTQKSGNNKTNTTVQQQKKTGVTASAKEMPRGQPRKGGRRPRETEEDKHLNDEDKQRRDKRRERNKQAAARCRRRREERMATLEQQVLELQAENSEKEKCIQDLRKQLERLEALTAHNGILRTDQMEQMISAGSNVRDGRSHQKGNGVGSILPPPVTHAGRKRLLHVPPFKLERPDSAIDPSPGTPPNGHFPNGSSMLLNGADPAISEAALDQQQQSIYDQQKRFKYDPVVTTAAMEITLANEGNNSHRPSSINSRPTTLPLDLLYKEGYVANTPSKDLATFSTIGGIGGLLGTPGNELITPGMNSGTFGVLMAQQTGLTPCQHGPVPVLLHQQQEDERPPSGQLSELR